MQPKTIFEGTGAWASMPTPRQITPWTPRWMTMMQPTVPSMMILTLPRTAGRCCSRTTLRMATSVPRPSPTLSCNSLARGSGHRNRLSSTQWLNLRVRLASDPNHMPPLRLGSSGASSCHYPLLWQPFPHCQPQTPCVLNTAVPKPGVEDAQVILLVVFEDDEGNTTSPSGMITTVRPAHLPKTMYSWHLSPNNE